MADFLLRFHRWIWKEQWWHRKDRSSFEKFMDFYCERLYPVLWLICFIGFLFSSIHCQ